MISQIAGFEVLFLVFGGVLFGAIGTFMVMTYAWQARTTEGQIRMERYRHRIRKRFRRGHMQHH
jgi:hypothetical protein